MSVTQKGIAGVVNAAITDAGLSVRAVADDTGIPVRTLRARLSGTGRPFLVTEFAAIAAVLGVMPSDLIARAERAQGARQ